MKTTSHLDPDDVDPLDGPVVLGDDPQLPHPRPRLDEEVLAPGRLALGVLAAADADHDRVGLRALLAVEEGEHERRGEAGHLVLLLLAGGLGRSAFLLEDERETRLVHDPDGAVDSDPSGLEEKSLNRSS